VPTLRWLPVAALAGGALLLSGCASDSPDSTAGADGISVITAFYPLEYAATAVGADTITVTSLTPPGAEPHDLELSAAQVADIASADLVVYVRGFQPALDEAIDQQAGDRAIDVTAELELLGDDPHVWLDPKNMATIGQEIANRLVELEPDATGVSDAATEFTARMEALDAEYQSALATCASRDLVVSHEAFGYLADAYGLTQVGISGLSPEAEPSPARLREIADLVQQKGITTIYYETLVDPRIAETIADETGAATAVLDPLEGLLPDSTGDYESIMRDNLATLVAGQGCT
jgi:zinc transport system substrate-binding protein